MKVKSKTLLYLVWNTHFYLVFKRTRLLITDLFCFRILCSESGKRTIALLDCFEEEHTTSIVSVLRNGQVFK